MASNASHGNISVQIYSDPRNVMRILQRLDVSLAPAAMGVWMGATVAPWIRRRATERFQREGDDVSGMWAPLKPATQNIRAQQGYGAAHPINHRTSKLESYITGSPERVTVHSLGATLTMPGRAPAGELKTKVLTAQIGKPYPRTVARPVIGMNERDLLAVLTDLSLYVSTGQFR